MIWFHSTIIFAKPLFLPKIGLPTWQYKSFLIYTKLSLWRRNALSIPFIYAQILYAKSLVNFGEMVSLSHHFSNQTCTRVFLPKTFLPTWHYKLVMHYNKWSLWRLNYLNSPNIFDQTFCTKSFSKFQWDGITLPSFLQTIILHECSYQKLASQLDITY